jgi:adenosylcobinamide kinase/adenosylcobinamide-phosphate guanylyltransferase
MMLPRHRLVLGGARSGKSRHALACAEALGPRRLFIATAEPGDAEMAERIARHQAERGAGWQTLEAPLDLPGTLRTATAADVVVVDCLTIWLSNLILAARDTETETESLLKALSEALVPTVLVSNEVGLGVVPDTSLGRHFRDTQGRLNQRVAAAADHVDFVVAGVALALKAARRPEPNPS